MFLFTRKPSSGSHKQYLAKNTGLVQCRYRRRTDVVSVMAALYRHNTYNVCATSVPTLNQSKLSTVCASLMIVSLQTETCWSNLHNFNMF
jgi:hypothetical protein